jgi:hypothetical protein
MRKSDAMKRYAHCPDCGAEMRPSALLCRACFKRAGGAWAPLYRAAAARGESRHAAPDTLHQSQKTDAMNRKTRTIGEEEFEKYLTAAGYPFEYEKVWPGKTRRPDYTVTRGGDTFLFDVKDFDPKLPVVGFSQVEMYSGIRRQIEAGRQKFREFKEFPCCVVLRNNGNMFARIEDPVTVSSAMYGDFGWAIPVHVGHGPAPVAVPPIRPTFLGGAQMLPNKNTTISALLTVRYVAVGRPRMKKILAEDPTMSLEEARVEARARFGDGLDEGETQQGVIVFENVHARRPLPRDMFSGPYDVRFGADGTDFACVFYGPALAALET